MARRILQVTGSCLLGCTFLLIWVCHNTAQRVTGIDRDFTLQLGAPVSIAFTPGLEASYVVGLEFDRSQQRSLDCHTIQSSSIQWTLMKDGESIDGGKLTDSRVRCNDQGNTATLSFDLANFMLDRQHSLNFSILHPRQPSLKLQSRISIKPYGIDVHYAFADLAMQEIAVFLGLVVSFFLLFTRFISICVS